MANLLDLPTELQICIFSSADNIDDALHLARTCKLLNAVFEDPHSRLMIFRSIITHSDLHKYDVLIHAGDTFYANYAATYYSHRVNPQRHQRPIYPDDKVELGFSHAAPSSASRGASGLLPAETVWTIVTRWHAMKLLYNLYLDSRVRPDYLLSPSLHGTYLYNPPLWVEQIPSSTPIPPPSNHDLIPIPYYYKHTAYERFYRGLCNHWWLINNIWCARICRYRNLQAFDEMFFRDLRRQWTHTIPRSLQEKVEAFEVAEFVWGYLARKVWEGRGFVREWVSSPRNRVLFDGQTADGLPSMDVWVHVVLEGLRYMRPTQVLEVLFGYVWGVDEAKLDVDRWVYGLGLFDIHYGVREEEVEDQDMDGDGDDEEDEEEEEEDDDDAEEEGENIPQWLLLQLMNAELIGMHYLVDESQPLGDSKDFCWDRYRFARWPRDLRGKPVMFPEPADELEYRIMAVVWHPENEDDLTDVE